MKSNDIIDSSLIIIEMDGNDNNQPDSKPQKSTNIMGIFGELRKSGLIASMDELQSTSTGMVGLITDTRGVKYEVDIRPAKYGEYFSDKA